MANWPRCFGVFTKPKSIADRGLREPRGYAAGVLFDRGTGRFEVDWRRVKVGQESSRQPIDSGGSDDMIPPPSAEQETLRRRFLISFEKKSRPATNLVG